MYKLLQIDTEDAFREKMRKLVIPIIQADVVFFILYFIGSAIGDKHLLAPMGIGTDNNPTLSAYIHISTQLSLSPSTSFYDVSIESASASQVLNVLNVQSNKIVLPNQFLNGSEKAPVATFIDTTADSVFVKYEGDKTGESYLLLPESALGREYFVITSCKPFGTCQIAIVSTTSNNEVTIRLPSSFDGNTILVIYGGVKYESDDVIEDTLSGFDSIQIACQCDLTGTRVTAIENIAVFAGSFTTRTAWYPGEETFLIEQLIPTNVWGNRFNLPPFNDINKSVLNVVAAHDDTFVFITGYNEILLYSGQWVAKNLLSADLTTITSTKPVMAVLFYVNANPDLSNNGTATMILLQPFHTREQQYIFSSLLDSGTSGNCVAFTIQDEKRGSYINGNFVSTQHYMTILRSQIPQLIVKSFYIRDEDNDVKTKSFMTAYMLLNQDYIFGNMIGGNFSQSFDEDFPAYPGDDKDNDGDGMIDEDMCTSTTQNTHQMDCGKRISESPDHKGVSFVVSFWNISQNMENQESEMHILSQYRNTITIQYPNRNTNVYYVMENTMLQINVPVDYVGNGDGLSENVISITSTKEISIHVLMKAQSGRASSLILPSDVLGTKYYAVTHCPSGYCGCYITPAYDTTTVEINLSTGTSYVYNGRNYTRDNIMEVIVQFGESFLLSMNDDLSGTFISGNYPIAVMCGSLTDTGVYMEQMLPVRYYLPGTFVSFPTPSYLDELELVVVTDTGYDVCTIQTSDKLTKLTQILSLPGDHFKQVITNRENVTVVVNCTKPVAVMVVVLGNQNTDGFMTHLLNVAMLSSEYLFPYMNSDFISMSVLNIDNDNLVFVNSIENRTTQSTSVYLLNKDDVELGEIIGAPSGVIHIISLLNVTQGNQISVYSIGADTTVQMTAPYVSSFGTVAGIYLPERVYCNPSLPFVSDGIDNDCDGLIDEEICINSTDTYDEVIRVFGSYIPDFDLDGIIGEDCGSFLKDHTTTTTAMTTTMTMTSTETTNSSCPCTCSTPKNYTTAEFAQHLADIKKNLTLDKSTLTLQRMSKVCAMDSRTSSSAIGCVGIVILAMTFGMLFLADLSFYKSLLCGFKSVVRSVFS